MQIHLNVHLGHYAEAFIHNKDVCQKKEKQHIAVGTVRCSENQVPALTMSRLTHSLYTTRRVACCTTQYLYSDQT